MSYGRNFSFLVPPDGKQRKGRFFNDQGADIPIGVPVIAAYAGGATDAVNALDMEPVVLADGAQAPPDNGRGGIAVYEYGPNAFAGDDPALTVHSDKDVVPDGAAVQVVSGHDVKVLLRNTEQTTFLQTRVYPGRTMVAGLGATPTVAVGEYLTPAGTPNDTNGYWAEDASVANAWLVITKVDATRNELEAQLMF